ncbi:3'-5' exonuclease [Paenibacillus sp. YIM B09110]|uniref:3'-5' exonuclease n=1 Tax=Paenibacillus sp. YIM B09110 TaxID=3126102 RepID=UPI00301C5453
MRYIVFDLEFTVNRKQQYLSEIIEIGAIELYEDENGVAFMTDLFQTYVMPVRETTLTKMTLDFTGITQQQIDNAPNFATAVEQFRDWLGGEDYYLCAWGPDDKIQFVRQCQAAGLEISWIRNYNDIQLQFTRLQGGDVGQRISLKKALRHADITMLGKHHNALDDAFNTAKLFVRVKPQLVLELNNAAEDSLNMTKIVYSSGDDDNKPFSQLAQLLGMVI